MLNISTKSNHPIIIKKKLPEMIEKGLTDSPKVKKYLKTLYPHTKVL